MRRALGVLLIVGLVSTASPAAAQNPIVAQFWYSFGGKNREVTEAHIKKFNESQSRYRIEGIFQGDYFQALAKIRAASVTHSVPAVFHVIGQALPQLWQQRLFETLEPYANGPNGTNLADFYPGLTQETYFDYLGRYQAPLFAIPFFRSTPILYYNADMLKAKGVAVPTTWNELRDAAAKLTVRAGNDIKVYGFEVPIDWWFWYAMLHEAGGRLLTPDGKKAAFRDKGAEALEFWVTLVNKDKTMKRPPGKDYNAWEVTNTDFVNQRVAMIYTSTAFLNYMTENV